MINQTEIIYEIFICTGRKHSSGITSTANAWIKIHGHFGSTQVIKIPHGHNLIEIKVDISFVKCLPNLCFFYVS